MNALLLVIGTVLLVISSYILYINKIRKTDGISPADKKLGLTCSILAIVLCVLSGSFVIIPTGYTGVKTTFGQINSEAVQNGFNWKIPFVQSVEKVNNKQQDIVFKDKIWSETSTRTAIYYENITVTYQINPEKSAWIFANVSNYKEQLVPQTIVASAIKSSSKELKDTDATNRSIIEPLSTKNIQEALNSKYGTDAIIINKVTIDNADFEESYNKAVSDKQNAQIEAEKQAIENQKAIDKAEADAKVNITNANAEADANKLLEKSLTPQILQEKYIEKWNGTLPSVLADDSSSLILPSVD